jgi:hypothetical protein
MLLVIEYSRDERQRTFRSHMSHRDDKRIAALLRRHVAEDPAFVAGIRDFGDDLPWVDATATCCARRCVITEGVNSTSKGTAALNAARSW